MTNTSKTNNDEEPTKSNHSPGEIITATQNLAVNLIRDKVKNLYTQEPDAAEEEIEAEASTRRSKHQQFMYELTTSNKDLVQIQTAWHNYYLRLNDADKKQVWQEFYDSNQNISKHILATQELPSEHQAQQLTQHVNERAVYKPKSIRRSADTIRRNIRTKAQTPPKLTWKHHLQSALFGLSMGAIVVFILLFGFFNQVFIAPFIQPSRHDTATPIILSNTTVAPSPTPQVIIPKINVEIPVNYSAKSTSENLIETDLQGGVVHYPTTSFPGQTGNAAFFGHSSNNIFNPGKYKFAFVLLHDLVPGDVFYLTYHNTVYAYKVFSTTIVSPNDVSVLNPINGHNATATLITCDPPGTSLNRLVVVGNQISPNPVNNTTPTPTVTTTNNVNKLPGNGPSYWSRFISTTYGKVLTVLLFLIIVWYIWRWYRKEFKAN
jgi:LPXTG-site transpeptidase (sortase) family protein